MKAECEDVLNVIFYSLFRVCGSHQRVFSQLYPAAHPWLPWMEEFWPLIIPQEHEPHISVTMVSGCLLKRWPAPCARLTARGVTTIKSLAAQVKDEIHRSWGCVGGCFEWFHWPYWGAVWKRNELLNMLMHHWRAVSEDKRRNYAAF